MLSPSALAIVMRQRPAAGPTIFDVFLDPEELVTAWHPATRRLILPTEHRIPLRQQVAARVHATGFDAGVTVTGTVVSTYRHGDRYRVELEPDQVRLSALWRLVSAARGDGAFFEPRASRFLARLPAVVHTGQGLVYMTTFSVSERGCGLLWSGPLPEVGATIDMRFGAGKKVAAFRGVVCWCSLPGRGATVGVRFVTGREQPWTSLLGEVARGGAPAT
jgi:PilZ domain